MLALTRHLFFVIGGERWEQAELLVCSTDDWLLELKRAVSTKREEGGLASALALECTALADAPQRLRVERLASLVRSFLYVPHPDWICEYALRLASDPANATVWAGSNNSEGIKQLVDTPTLARAARFLVLAIDRKRDASASAATHLYGGWEWS